MHDRYLAYMCSYWLLIVDSQGCHFFINQSTLNHDRKTSDRSKLLVISGQATLLKTILTLVNTTSGNNGKVEENNQHPLKSCNCLFLLLTVQQITNDPL